MQTAFRHRLIDALPFWLSLGMVPLVVLAARQGGWWFALLPIYAWYLTTFLDVLLGLNTENPDPKV